MPRPMCQETLEPFRLDGAYQARAYAAASAAWLARLKTAVAFQFHLDKESPWEVHHTERGSHGFTHISVTRPVPWVLALVDPEHAAPARLLASLVPAVLAGVRSILIVCPEPLSAVNSVALEIAGLEDIYVTPSDIPVTLLKSLSAESEGRLLLFPAANSRYAQLWDDLARAAKEARVPCRCDTRPHLCFQNDTAPDSERRAMALLAHGDAEWTFLAPNNPNNPDGTDDAEPPCDACLTCGRPSRAPLLLGPGLEACWIAKDCGRDFFRTVRMEAELTNDSAEEDL